MGDYVLTFGKYKDKTIEDIASISPHYVTWLAGSVSKFSLQKDVKATYQAIQDANPDAIASAKKFIRGKCPKCLGDCKYACATVQQSRNYHYHPYGKRD